MGGEDCSRFGAEEYNDGKSTEWGGEPENNPVVLWVSETLGLISKSRMQTVPTLKSQKAKMTA